MEIWDVHKKIYHYTGQQGLEGILSHNVLWATHYKCLNDKSEIIHILPALRKAIRPAVSTLLEKLIKANPKPAHALLQKHGSFDSFLDHEAQTMVSVPHRVTFGGVGAGMSFHPYIISFCHHASDYERGNGLLSQWRGYGNSLGYAIEFDTAKLWKAIEFDAKAYAYSMTSLGEVVYEGDQKKFDEEFSELISEICQLPTKVVLDKSPDLQPLFKPFLDGATRFKHAAFSQEREVRAVLAPFNQNWMAHFKENEPENFDKLSGKGLKQIRFRTGFIPYIELALNAENDLPITRIIVGPHQDREVQGERLKRFFELKGLKVDVVVSDMPLI